MDSVSRTGRCLTIPALGLDVGYAFTKGAFNLGGPKGPISDHMFPSHAPLLGSTSFAVSRGAAMKGVLLPSDQPDKSAYVGPDVMYYLGSQFYRDLSTAFPRTSVYRNLLDGMLWMIAKSMSEINERPQDIRTVNIGLLVGGLPFSTLEQHHGFVLDLMQRERTLPPIHPRGEPIAVTVRGSEILGQPLGTQLYHWATTSSVPDNRTVTLDLGGGTFDWFTTEGQMPIYQMCDSHARGVLACAVLVAESIERGLADDPAIVSRIEMALSMGEPTVKVSGQDVVLTAHSKASDVVLHECVAKMSGSLGGLKSVDELLLTGGGAKLLHRFLQEHYPELNQRVVLMAKPQLANAYGFLLYAQTRSRRLLAMEAA